MLETYATEDKIEEERKRVHTVKIGDRFQCNLKHLPLGKPYSIGLGHYAFGYLPDPDFFNFLKRLRVCFLEGRPDTPGIFIAMEVVTEKK